MRSYSGKIRVINQRLDRVSPSPRATALTLSLAERRHYQIRIYEIILGVLPDVLPQRIALERFKADETMSDIKQAWPDRGEELNREKL